MTVKPSQASHRPTQYNNLIAYIHRHVHNSVRSQAPTPTRPTSDSSADWPANRGLRKVRRHWWHKWPGCTSYAGAESEDRVCPWSQQRSLRLADPTDMHHDHMQSIYSKQLALLAYRCLHGLAPPYLANELQSVSTLDTRRRLRSATTNALVVQPTRLSTVSDRAFPVAAARVWNSLSVSVTWAATLNTFKQRLKTELFIRCYDLPSSYARKHSVYLCLYCCTTHFLFFLVKCPSSLWTSCHYNKFRLIIIIIKKSNLAASPSLRCNFKSKFIHGWVPVGAALISNSMPSARHQPKWQDHRHGAKYDPVIKLILKQKCHAL